MGKKKHKDFGPIDWLYEQPFRSVDGEETLSSAQARLFERFKEGKISDCPCCSQTVKRYARSVNDMMVRALAIIARYGEEGCKSKTVLREIQQGGGGDYSKLRYWGLTRRQFRKLPGKGKSGAYWCITERGRDFLRGRASIAAYAFVYNDVVLGYTQAQVFVSECADKGFSFEELMDPRTGMGGDAQAA